MGIIGTYTPEDLFSGKFLVVDDVRMIPTGTAAFKRGAVLTAANIPVLAGTVANADCIALEDIDASAADAPIRCVVAIAGGFNSNALTTGDDTDPATLKDTLRAKSIYLTAALTISE
jgi:hypothetical protein